MVQKAISSASIPQICADKQQSTCAFRFINIFKSLKLQFVLLVSAIVISCALVAVWIDTRAELHKNHAIRMSQAGMFSQLLARSISSHLINYTIHDLSELLDDTSKRPNVNYIVVTSTLIEELELSYFKPQSEALVKELLVDEPVQFIQSAKLTEQAYHVSIPILVGEKRAGALYIGWQMEGSWQLLPCILKRELITTLPMFLIIVLLIFS